VRVLLDRHHGQQVIPPGHVQRDDGIVARGNADAAADPGGLQMRQRGGQRVARLVRFTRKPVGFVPTQIDYSDYRDVAGVKMAFKKVVSQTFMQMTIELTDVQPNVAVDASRFAQPR
jgi:hypothetical protein